VILADFVSVQVFKHGLGVQAFSVITNLYSHPSPQTINWYTACMCYFSVQPHFDVVKSRHVIHCMQS
jgi:hypothetical protein